MVVAIVAGLAIWGILSLRPSDSTIQGQADCEVVRVAGRLGGIVPGYWASTAYVYMYVLGSSLSQVSHLYLALWVLTAVLFVIAYAIERFVLRPRYEAMRLESELDPDIVREQTLYQMGDDDLPDAEWIGDSDE